jgi:glycerol-3-phosphate dehydrogenase
MKREIEKLEKEKFDVLIIGGGIHGAAIVRECVRNGYKTCLIEKDDFGSQTSANSLKVLHGGLRYLQHANFKRMRESIYSRKTFQQIAPHLVKNVPFLIPTSGYAVKSKLALAIALKLNDIISYDRNKNIDKENFIPGGKTISKTELLQVLPGIEKDNITGGAVWYESIALNTERLLFEFLYEAFDNGATLVNYAKAEKFEFENGRISKVKIKDELSGKEFYADADLFIDSVGPWLNSILKETEDYKKLYSPLTKAVNIVVKKNFFKEYAVGIESVKEFKDKAAVINKGKRLFFFVPIGDYTMIGTTYKIYKDEPDNCKIEKEDVIEILNEINSAYKPLNLKYEDVTIAHVGTQAMPDEEFENEFDVQPETHSKVFDHATEGKIQNLISVKSVKYTTAPSIASNIAELLKNKIKPSGKILDRNTLRDEYSSLKKSFFENKNYDREMLKRLWNTYGMKSQHVLNYIEKDATSKQIITEEEKIYFGELQYNIKEEMAITSEDVIHRRLGLTAFEDISEENKSKIQEAIRKII